MRWAATVWVALAILSPALTHLIWPRLRSRLQHWEPYLRSFAPWLHGVGPAYLALITGAIRARDFGLAAQEPLAWAADLMAGGIWIAATARYLQPAGKWPKPARGVLDEPRWALYRAVGALWVGSRPLGTLIGLVLALAESGLEAIPGPGGWSPAWEALARAASSALIFAITGSFWLTLVTQGITLYLLRGRRL